METWRVGRSTVVYRLLDGIATRMDSLLGLEERRIAALPDFKLRPDVLASSQSAHICGLEVTRDVDFHTFPLRKLNRLGR